MTHAINCTFTWSGPIFSTLFFAFFFLNRELRLKHQSSNSFQSSKTPVCWMKSIHTPTKKVWGKRKAGGKCREAHLRPLPQEWHTLTRISFQGGCHLGLGRANGFLGTSAPRSPVPAPLTTRAERKLIEVNKTAKSLSVHIQWWTKVLHHPIFPEKISFSC